jgi:hypothetical protein
MESQVMTKRFYIPETHDPILTELNTKCRRTDGEIADEMGFDKKTIWTHRQRLRLPTNIRPRPVQMPTEKDFTPPPDKPNPVTVASRWLGSRLVEKPSGFWLDGRPVSLDTLMRATNEVLKGYGMPQVGVEKWWV